MLPFFFASPESCLFNYCWANLLTQFWEFEWKFETYQYENGKFDLDLGPTSTAWHCSSPSFHFTLQTLLAFGRGCCYLFGYCEISWEQGSGDFVPFVLLSSGVDTDALTNMWHYAQILSVGKCVKYLSVILIVLLSSLLNQIIISMTYKWLYFYGGQ